MTKCVGMPTVCKFQSTPPARGATVKNDYPDAFIKISIHAPREGGDSAMFKGLEMSMISIHAPREGGDACWQIMLAHCWRFQSTPPARGATPGKCPWLISR